MNQIQTRGIILSRTDYGEADRILTVLTYEHGKLRLMARGVRRPKSKLAGGIELFSVSDLSFIRGRGEIGTLISSRLVKYYGSIVNDLNRVQLGYDLIKILNKATEDEPESEYFNLLEESFAALDNSSIETDLIRTWFNARLLRLSGHTPNLQTTASGSKLEATQHYDFDFDDMSFAEHADGRFAAPEIKFLRLLFGSTQLAIITKVQGGTELTEVVRPAVQTMLQMHIRV